LWHARFVKSRTRATALCESGKLRVGSEAVTKAHRLIRIGDVLTFPLAGHIRTVKVCGFGARRGPAPEAQSLYQDLVSPAPETGLPRERSGSANARKPV